MATKSPKPPEQNEIKNSLRPVRIDITERDIKAGKVMDPSSCAAAQAIMRTLKANEVRVHRGVTYIKTKSGWMRFKTSTALRMETIVFDRGGEFIPGEYDLQVVPASQLLPKKKKSLRSGKSVRDNKLSTRRRVISHVRASARLRTEDEGEE